MRYLTKDWFLKCQIYPQTKALRNELDGAAGAFRAEQAKQALPPSLLGSFMFHDGIVSGMDVGADCTIEVQSPYSQYNRIIFCGAVIKQPLPPVGATWLYEELYRHKSGVGYEAHILFYNMMKPKHKQVLASDIIETMIICKDILFEQ